MEWLDDRTLLSAAFDIVGLTALRAEPAFSNIDGRGIGIAVLDTGVFAQNPDLRPNLVHFYDAVASAVDPNLGNDAASLGQAFDRDGHGSHTAGTAASSDRELGVAYNASLISIRALRDQGEPLPNNRDPVATALQWVLENYQRYNILVVNMSLGAPTTNFNAPQALNNQGALIQQLQALGVTVVASSGNNYGDFAAPGASTPAIYATLSVANTWATDGQGNSFPSIQGQVSQPGQFVAVETEGAPDRLSASSQRSTLSNQVAAPGTDILSTWNGENGQLTNVISGTSMSAPLVSGLVALMQQQAYQAGGRYLTPAEVRSIVRGTADTIVDSNVPTNRRAPLVLDATGRITLGQPSDLPETGLSFPRVNVFRAVQATRQLVMTGGGSGGGGADTNSTTANTLVLPQLDGNRVYDFIGAIGHDGQVQIGANDVDLYRLVLDSPGEIVVQTGHVDGGTDFDSFLRLFDASGREIASHDDINFPSNRFSAIHSSPQPAGTYYIGISSFNNGSYTITTGSGASNGRSTGDYDMSIALINPDPNGILTGAKVVESLPFYAPGLIESDPPPANSTTRIDVGTADVDTFQLTAPDDGVLIIDVDATEETSYGPSVAAGGLAVDGYLRVFDAQGREIAAIDDEGPGQLDPSLRIPVTRGATIYVAISDFNNATYDPNNPYGRNYNGFGGRYDLFLLFDNGDLNGSIFTAAPGTLGQTVQGIVGADPDPQGTFLTVGRDGSKDVDFVSFTPTQGGLLDVGATGVSGFDPALALWIYDPDQIEATRVAQSASGSSQIIARVQANTTYYVSITGQGNDDFQWYAPATGNGGQTGQFTLAARIRPESDAVLLTDNQVQGLAPAVQDIVVNGQIRGDIGRDSGFVSGPADIDLYRFVPTVNQTVVIRTETTPEGSADTFLRVFDAQGGELAFNDNADPQRTASQVRLQVTAGQTYYIGVNGAGPQARGYNPLTGAGTSPGSQGPYVLTLVGETEVNQPPVLAEIANQAVAEGGAVSVTATASDPNRPANTLRFSLDAGAPAGAAIDPVTGVFSWTPGEAQGPGSFAITVRVTDDGTPALSATRSFTVAVSEVNQPPALAVIADRTVAEGSPVTSTATASDPDQPANTLRFSLDAGAPAGAAIDPVTGVFSWTPGEAQGPGSFAITVRVTDDGTSALSVARTFTVAVAEVNQPPTLATIADRTVAEGSPVSFSATASDPDQPANTLRFSLDAGVPAGAGIDPVSGVFTWTPPRGAASAVVTVRVTDNGNPSFSAFQAVTINVLPVPVTSVRSQLVTRRRTPTGIALSFDNDLGAASAGSLTNYRLVSAGRDRRFDTRDDRPIRLRAAAYDPAARAVTLSPQGGRLNLTQSLRLTVSGVADALGRLLDGDRDGRPGGDLVVVVTRQGITAAGRADVGAVSPPTVQAVDMLLEDGIPSLTLRRQASRRAFRRR